MQTTGLLPGIYPQITSRDPSQRKSGQDNLGMGYTEHGEQFMLKPGNSVGVAEFIGAKVSDACGIPACQPTIVTIETFNGAEHVFGSRIESGLIKFDQTSIAHWNVVLENCQNPNAFSAMLSIDLALGNDDRHWNNWLVQEVENQFGERKYRLRAMDFSRSWPVRHPAQHPLRHHSKNTWDAAKDWDLLGVSFDLQTFHGTCVKIAALPTGWLRGSVLEQLIGVFLTSAEADQYCDWWSRNIRSQITETIHSLEYGVRP